MALDENVQNWLKGLAEEGAYTSDPGDPLYEDASFVDLYDVDTQEDSFGGEGFWDVDYEQIEEEESWAGTARDFIAGLFPGATAADVQKFAKDMGTMFRGESPLKMPRPKTRRTPSSSRSPERLREAKQTLNSRALMNNLVNKSERARDAQQRIQNAIARSVSPTSNNDLYELISGSTTPRGTKTSLKEGLRQLAVRQFS